MACRYLNCFLILSELGCRPAQKRVMEALLQSHYSRLKLDVETHVLSLSNVIIIRIRFAAMLWKEPCVIIFVVCLILSVVGVYAKRSNMLRM